MPLSADQQAELRELVTPAAWAFYSALPDDQKLNLDVRFRMVGGDLNRLAAAVLRVACLHAGRAAVGTGAGGKERIKIGPIELEESGGGGSAASAVDSAAWCKLAGELEALSAGSGTPEPALTSWDSGGWAEGEVGREW